MPKLKTHKATAKRLYRTGGQRLMKRAAGQDHFNARDRGIVTMRKRRDVRVHKTDSASARTLIPYS